VWCKICSVEKQRISADYASLNISILSQCLVITPPQASLTMKLNNAEVNYMYQQIWFFSWWEKSLQLQTLPNTWRTGNLAPFKDRAFQRHIHQIKSVTLQNHGTDKCFLSKLYFQFIYHLILTWFDHRSQTQISHSTHTTINMPKCKCCIEVRFWKNGLRTDFQKQLKFSSTLIHFPNPLRPILFLTLQALHSLCVHFLPHTGSM